MNDVLTLEALMQLGETERYAYFINQFRALGFATVTGEYHGSGDSTDQCYSNATRRNDKGKLEDVDRSPKNEQILSLFENFCFEVSFEKVGDGWYNNDGGHGTVTVDVEACQIDFEHWHYETSSYADDSNGRIFGPPDVESASAEQAS